MSTSLTPRQRFYRKTEIGPGCWNWKAHTFRRGYGMFWLENKNRRANRALSEEYGVSAQKIARIKKGIQSRFVIHEEFK